MASWTSLAVLSALAVSTLNLPGPGSAHNIPQEGTGRSSQYYVLNSDGTYNYGHNSGEGAFENVRLNKAGKVLGEFGYTDIDGNNVNLQYKSGKADFIARGDHLPVPHPDFNAAHANALARPPFKDPLADPNSDASYNFQYAVDGQSRSEQSDADGNVRGSYSYIDEEGKTRSFNYIAGSETGFVIEENGVPQGPTESGLTPAATFSLSSSKATSPGQSTSGSGRVVNQSPESRLTSGSSYLPSNTASTGSKETSESSIYESNASHSAKSNASYSFSYDAGDHSRSESADANLNVEGQFSFVADDGVQRSVSYAAGPNGFQAAGDHLPTPPESHFGDRISSSTGAQTSYGLATASRMPANSRLPIPSHTQFVSQVPTMKGSTSSTSFDSYHPSVTASASKQTDSKPSSTSLSGVPFEEANIQSELRSDGSYDFAYDTLTHSQSESGDSDNNVTGHFHFVADDGERRGIQYEAGSATGFIVEGAHIPIGPAVPGAPSGQPTGRIVPVQEVPFVDPLADTDADASYGFSFESDQYSRSESADAEGNVQGTYTVVDEDGASRTYRYSAGKGVGFEIEEVSASQGPPPSKPTASSFSGSALSSSGGANTAAGSSSFHDAGSSASIGANTAVDSSSFHGAESSASIGANTAAGSSSFQGTDFSASSDANTGAASSSFHDAGSSASSGANTAVGSSSFHEAESSASIGANTAADSSSFHGAGSSAASGANAGAASSSFHGAGASSSKFHGSHSASSSAASQHGSSLSSAFHSTDSSSASFHKTSSSSSLHSASSSSTFHGGSGIKTISLIAPSPGFGRQLAASSLISLSRVPRRNTYKPVPTQEIFPRYRFHQYGTSRNPEKFGYVLAFDN